MRLSLACKHLELTDGIKGHVEDKSGRLEKFLKGRFDVNWVFDVEGGFHVATVVVNGKNFVHRAEGKTTNLYSSIDMAYHKVERQIKKTKALVKEHRGDRTPKQDLEELGHFKKVA